MWEFPGGKIEKGESPEQCLQRELFEEMNIIIRPYQKYGENVHNYGQILIRLIAYRAAYVSGDIILVDHDEYLWVHEKDLGEYQFAAADIKFVEMLGHERYMAMSKQSVPDETKVKIDKFKKGDLSGEQ